jgi:hypothetical protein
MSYSRITERGRIEHLTALVRTARRLAIRLRVILINEIYGRKE